jgi:transposase
VRKSKLWKKLLHVEHVVLEDGDIETAPDGSEIAVVRLRPDSGRQLRCPECGGKCRFYDSGEGRRRWRALDLGVLRCYLEADAPRVRCPRHGVLTAAVPWARPAARFTIAFEEHAAWLCAQMPWSKAARLLRTTWRTLQSIVERVVTGLRDGKDRLDRVRRIGIDEKAWRKGHHYITVVIDHDAGRIMWAAGGRNKETLAKFFGDLGEERARLLTHVSADGADWIHDVVREKAPQALICLDAFHVVKWAGEALDGVRRRLAGALRAAGKGDQAAALGQGMWALRKNPGGLSPGQRQSLAQIAAGNKQLYKAYLMKEQLREVFSAKGERGSSTSVSRVCRVGQERRPGTVRWRAAPPAHIDDMSVETRAYRLSFVLAHHNLGQVPARLREGISVNARSKIFFNASPEDVAQLARHTLPALTAHDLSHLDVFQAAARLVTGGAYRPSHSRCAPARLRPWYPAAPP